MRDLVPFFGDRSSLTRSVFDELDRALNSVFGKDFFSTSLNRSAYPKMNIYDKDNKLKIDAYIPEVPKDKLNVTIEDDVLTIEGASDKDKKIEDNKYYCREVSKRAFKRCVQLPDNVDTNKINASHDDGMLRIEFPYKEAKEDKSSVKKINIG